jgi:hypothetical protein
MPVVGTHVSVVIASPQDLVRGKSHAGTKTDPSRVVDGFIGDYRSGTAAPE